MKHKLLLLSLLTSINVNATTGSMPTDLNPEFDRKHEEGSRPLDPPPPNTGIQRFLVIGKNNKPAEMQVDVLKSENARLKELVQELNATNAKQLETISIFEDVIHEMRAHVEDLDSRLTKANILYMQEQQHADQLLEANGVLNKIVQQPGSPFDGWVYSPEFGWVFLNSVSFPYMYRSETNSWLFYQVGTYPRTFFDYSTREWITLDTAHMEQLYDGTFDK